jgi:hypothetical protein
MPVDRVDSHLEDKVFQAHKRKGDEIRAALEAQRYICGGRTPQERIFGVYYINSTVSILSNGSLTSFRSAPIALSFPEPWHVD